MLCIPEELNSPSLWPSLCALDIFLLAKFYLDSATQKDWSESENQSEKNDSPSSLKPSFKGTSRHFLLSQAKASSALNAVQSLFLASQKPLGVAKTHLYLRES